MHSWRILLLPYLEGQNLYDQYRFDEPWDGPNNRKLVSQIPSVYQCPSHGHHGEPVGEYVTNYLAVVGPQTVFRGAESATYTEITDGTSQTILVVDVNKKSVNWMAPRDITAKDFRALFTTETEFNHSDGTLVGMADGSTHYLSSETPPDDVKALTTSNSGDRADRF